MAGILELLGLGTGTGTIPTAPAGTTPTAPMGIGQRLMGMVGNNTNTLGMMGMQLALARTAEEQRQGAMSGFMYGSAMDQARKKQETEDAEKLRKEQQLNLLKASLAAKYPDMADVFKGAGDTETLTTLMRTAGDDRRFAADERYRGENLGMERERLRLAQEDAERRRNAPIEANAPLVQPDGKGGYREVYRPESKAQPPINVGEGESLYDPNTRAMIPLPGRDPNKPTTAQLKSETDLRKEWTSASKDFNTVDDSYRRIVALNKDPNSATGASDVAFIYSYMKMLDPGSVVRDGEYATAQNTGSIPERVRGIYNQALSGQKLTPEIRNSFIKAAQDVYGAAADKHEATRSQFADFASRSNLDPDKVLGKYERIKPERKADRPTTPETDPYVQTAIERSKTNPALRKKLIEMGIIRE